MKKASVRAEKNRVFKCRTAAIALALALTSASAFAQGTFFTPGNVVVSVEGCGVYGGNCSSVPNGTGGKNSPTGYGDNQAGPFTLFQYQVSGASAATFVNSLQFPQASSGANFPVSGEYGSSSEGSVQLSGGGQYLTVMGYGINANTFNANTNAYSATPNAALAQSGSLTGQGYIPIPRVVTLIDANGNINSSTAIYNVFDTNNPRSTYTADGTNIYVSGQGEDDATGGVFLTTEGTVNNTPTSITGADAGSGESQDTRFVQIYNDTLYISMDSKSGSYNRSYIGTLGTPPATSVYSCGSACPTGDGTIGPALMTGFGNTGGTGREKLTAAETNGLVASGTYINLSPENYFFASPTVLYVADSGSPKNTSADNDSPYSLCGAGGLQKWVNVSGTWTWEYTLYKGLNLVLNGNSKSGDTTCSSNTSGTTGLLGLTGYVSGGVAYLFATNYTIADLDPSYLYGISDTVSATTSAGQSFTLLDTAPADSNFKGVSMAPSIPNGDVELTSVPSGLAITTSGTGCAPGTYTTPITLAWTPESACTMSVASPQAGSSGTQYTLAQWQDSSTGTSDTVAAPATTAVYTATFATQYALSTAASPAAGGTVSVASGYYNGGSTQTIQATPNAGYQFAGFSGGTLSGTTNPQSFTLNGPANVVANFTALAPSIAAVAGARTVLTSSSVEMGVTLTNNGLGAATNVQIASISPITVTSGSGSISVASGTGVDLGTIAADGGQTSTSVTFNWPSTATRASFTINFTADGGYSGSTTVTVLR